MDQLERSMTRPLAECNPAEFVNRLEQFLFSEKSASSSKLVGELRIARSYTFLLLTGIRLQSRAPYLEDQLLVSETLRYLLEKDEEKARVFDVLPDVNAGEMGDEDTVSFYPVAQ